MAAEPEEKETLGQRLMSLHVGESRLKFAKRLGVSDSTLGNYERDERIPDASFLARLREQAGVDINWLVAGHISPSSGGTIMDNGLVLDRATHQALTDNVSLPRYDVRASAGAGALVVSENVSEYFSVGRDWLRRNLPPWAPPNALVGILEGAGDSMEPTIRDGDLVMVVQDVDWRVVERGGIFVLSIDHDRLLLKRLQVMNNGDLRIISDNRSYEPEVIPMADIENRVRVHGQVFFAGGKPRNFT